MPRSTEVFAPGTFVGGRYRIDKFIARGLGEVYAAHDLELANSVALKTLRAERAHDHRQIERFKREIQLARKITHPNICRVFDVGYHVEGDREVPFLTMELLDGVSLDLHLERTAPWSIDRAHALLVQLVDALEAAHAAGVVHRDLKSSNIVLVGERAVITDFGLARSLEGDATVTAELAGTPAYMAPEQVLGRATSPSTDVYALGVTLFEIVTGRRPFESATPLEITTRKCQEPAPRASAFAKGLDPRWDDAIAACLEREVDDRLQHPRDVLDALARPRRRRRWPWLVGASAILASSAIVAVASREPAKPKLDIRTNTGRIAFGIGGGDLDTIEGVAFDRAGNLYVSGHSAGGFDLAGVSLRSVNKPDHTSFVFSLAPDGTVRWIRNFPGEKGLKLNAMSIAPDGKHLAVSGWTLGPAKIGGVDVTPALHNDGIAMLVDTATGVPSKVRQLGATERGQLRYIGYAPDGSIFLGGDFSGTVKFDRAYTCISNDRCPMIARYDGALDHVIWSHAASGTAIGRVWQAAFDGPWAYIVGQGDRGIAFDTGEVVPAGANNGFIARYDLATGKPSWIRGYGAVAGSQNIASVSARDGRLVAGGTYSTPMEVGGFTLPAGGAGNAYVLEVAPATGDVIWARGFASPTWDDMRQVDLRSDGVVVALGRRSGIMKLDANDVVPQVGNLGESEDGVFFELDKTGRVTRVQEMVTRFLEKPRTFTRDPKGVLTIAGTFQGGLTVDDRTLLGHGSYDGFVMQLP